MGYLKTLLKNDLCVFQNPFEVLLLYCTQVEKQILFQPIHCCQVYSILFSLDKRRILFYLESLFAIERKAIICTLWPSYSNPKLIWCFACSDMRGLYDFMWVIMLFCLFVVLCNHQLIKTQYWS